MSKVIEIAFAIDRSYIHHATISLFSLLRNNQNDKISVHFIHDGIPLDERASILELADGYRNCTVNFFEIDSKIFSGLHLNIEHISKETYYRYIIADIFENIDKIIYLDADTLIVGDIRELWQINIDSLYIAGVEDAVILDEGYKEKLGLADRDHYVNAGVLLMNLGKIRRDGKVRALFENTERLSHKIKYQDQDVINVTFQGGIGLIDKKFNFTSRDSVKSTDEYKDASILHYTGSDKPWLKRDESGRLYTHYLYDKYLEYYENRHVKKPALSELQEVLLASYKVFKSICDNNNLRYFANGGTKIGAVRHEGFIPWDDDIDIDMPIDDYEKFLEIAPGVLPKDYELKGMFGGMTSTLVRRDTMFTEYYYLGYPEKYTGVFIDIHPVFGVPADDAEQREFIDEVQLLANKIIFYSIAGEWNDDRVVSSEEYTRYRQLTRQFDIEESPKILATLGQRGSDTLFDRDLFLSFRNLRFEDTSIPVSADFDKDLKAQYGDYSIKAAPSGESERSIHVSRAVLDLNKPYSEFADELKGSLGSVVARNLTRQVALGWYRSSLDRRTILHLERRSESVLAKEELGIKGTAVKLVGMIYRKISK